MKGAGGCAVAVAWLILATIAASAYGVLNDLLTVTWSPEYFSVFKRHEFWWLLVSWGLTEAPTRLQAVAVGFAATWWFGLILGAILACAAIPGNKQRLQTTGFLRAIGITMTVTLACSFVFGVAAYLFEPSIQPNVVNWPFLEGIKMPVTPSRSAGGTTAPIWAR